MQALFCGGSAAASTGGQPTAGHAIFVSLGMRRMSRVQRAKARISLARRRDQRSRRICAFGWQVAGQVVYPARAEISASATTRELHQFGVPCTRSHGMLIDYICFERQAVGIEMYTISPACTNKSFPAPESSGQICPSAHVTRSITSSSGGSRNLSECPSNPTGNSDDNTDASDLKRT